MLGTVAALSSPLGVKLSMSLQGKYISRALGLFMLGMGSFMAFTLYEAYDAEAKLEVESKSGLESPDAGAAAIVPAGLTASPGRLATTVALGVVVGLAGGAFGVGGGVILVPILTRMTDVQTATATSLAAIIPPTLVSTFVCARNGLIVWPLTPALILGAAASSYFMAKYAASRLTKNEQKGCFVATMALLGTRMILVKS